MKNVLGMFLILGMIFLIVFAALQLSGCWVNTNLIGNWELVYADGPAAEQLQFYKDGRCDLLNVYDPASGSIENVLECGKWYEKDGRIEILGADNKPLTVQPAMSGEFYVEKAGEEYSNSLYFYEILIVRDDGSVCEYIIAPDLYMCYSGNTPVINNGEK